MITVAIFPARTVITGFRKVKNIILLLWLIILLLFGVAYDAAADAADEAVLC